MKLNRNNADINKLRDKKVAVRLVGKDAEIAFRKWLKENGIHFSDKAVLLIRNGIRTEICYCVERNSWDWCDEKWFKEKGYEIYEWEIAEEKKIYTIKDVVENACKIYRSTTNNCVYKYDNAYLYYKGIWKLSEPWRKTELTLEEIIKLTFTEYKPEPKGITFEEALKEMEQGKVCRSLYSGAEYLLSNDHFEELNGNYTTLSFNSYKTLSYKEIKEEWVVIDE